MAREKEGKKDQADKRPPVRRRVWTIKKISDLAGGGNVWWINEEWWKEDKHSAWFHTENINPAVNQWEEQRSTEGEEEMMCSSYVRGIITNAVVQDSA